MAGRTLIAGGMLAVAVCAGCHDPHAGMDTRLDESAFETIFDGTSFDGWEIIIEPGHEKQDDGFYLEDGTLACKGYGFHWFRYTEPLGDVVVRLEYKIPAEGNSGVVLRSTEQPPPPPFTGFEVQIMGDAGMDPNKHSTGAIYDIVCPMYNASRPHGEWNDLEIWCEGIRVRVILNGIKVIDTDFSHLTEKTGKFNFAYADMPREGYLCLQDHWTPIWYRNIRIKRLD